MHFGVHAGLQNTTTAELRSLWRRIEDHGFEWISVWDHFYAADASVRGDGPLRSGSHCLEALTTHTALALSTSTVRCGSLVYCAGYRHPAVYANAMATLDQLSGGRAVLGLGAGWHQGEYDAYGIPFPPVAERMRIFDEAVQCVRLLLDEEVADFRGEHFTLTDARCDPKPVQARFPIWVGGGGEKVTLRVAAQHADGWNVAFVSPETLRHKVAVLDRHCEAVGRDGGAIERSVNVALAWNEDDLVTQFGDAAPYIASNALKGSTQQVIDQVGAYRDAGAEWVILALRAPFDTDGLDRFAEEILPAFT
ncbi:MAG: TIGR03560 family F420-dependent LLM class oxidoreductase [Actinobacteria bacterium]|nr:TIGR03560 family F420-dependent LLM class oxidoreductase [Actinomycetota bacterium]